MNKLGDRNYALISSGVKTCGSYDPKECFCFFEEQLYVDEAETIEAFLNWVNEDTETRSFGSGNYEQRFSEFLKATKRNKTKGKEIATGGTLNWKVNTPQLLAEIFNNPGTAALVMPITILRSILVELTQRAIELNDPKLNAIMCRLALYEQSNPYDKGYDKEMTEKVINKFYNKSE